MRFRGSNGICVSTANHHHASTGTATHTATPTSSTASRTSSTTAAGTGSTTSRPSRPARHLSGFATDSWSPTTLQDDAATDNAPTGHDACATDDTGAHDACLGRHSDGAHCRNHAKPVAGVHNNSATTCSSTDGS